LLYPKSQSLIDSSMTIFPPLKFKASKEGFTGCRTPVLLAPGENVKTREMPSVEEIATLCWLGQSPLHTDGREGWACDTTLSLYRYRKVKSLHCFQRPATRTSIRVMADSTPLHRQMPHAQTSLLNDLARHTTIRPISHSAHVYTHHTLAKTRRQRPEFKQPGEFRHPAERSSRANRDGHATSGAGADRGHSQQFGDTRRHTERRCVNSNPPMLCLRHDVAAARTGPDPGVANRCYNLLRSFLSLRVPACFFSQQTLCTSVDIIRAIYIPAVSAIDPHRSNGVLSRVQGSYEFGR